MRGVKSVVLGAAAGLSAVSALSTGCTTQIAALALGDLGSCLALTSLLSVVQGGNGSIVDPLNSYLSTLCSSSTPTCSNSTLSSAQSAIQSGCSSDISSGGSDGEEVEALVAALNYYPEIYSAGCSKNSTTGGFCVTETLQVVQNVSGTQITTSFLEGLLSGDSSTTDALSQAVSSGQLCTGCVSEIYHEALAANSTLASTSVASSLTSQCGSSFGQSVSGVSTSAAATASTSSASSSSSTGAAPGQLQPLPFIVIGTALVGIVIGALVV